MQQPSENPPEKSAYAAGQGFSWYRAVVVGATVFLLSLGITHRHWLIDAPDSGHYRAMAEGHGENVPKPFSNRYLEPAVVRVLNRGFGLSLDHGFLAIALVSLLAFLVLCAVHMLRSGVAPIAAVPLLLIPTVLSSFENAYLPDLPHAALLAGLFAALMARRNAVLVVLLIVLLQLTRESSVLVVAVLAFVLWRRSHRSLALASVAACFAAMATVGRLTRGSAPNIHSLNTLAYIVGKLPFNFAENILGIRIWTNTFAPIKDLDPAYTMNVPRWLHLGHITRIGFLGVNASAPLATLAVWLTEFGVAPAVLLALLRRNRDRLRRMPPAIEVAAIYGTITFLIGPLLGASVERLVFYGWPAFVIAAPFILIQYHKLDASSAFGLLCLQLLCCWPTFIFSHCMTISRSMQIALTLTEMAFQYLAYRGVRALRHRDIPTQALPSMILTQ